jgi:hypothetical protein
MGGVVVSIGAGYVRHSDEAADPRPLTQEEHE